MVERLDCLSESHRVNRFPLLGYALAAFPRASKARAICSLRYLFCDWFLPDLGKRTSACMRSNQQNTDRGHRRSHFGVPEAGGLLRKQPGNQSPWIGTTA